MQPTAVAVAVAVVAAAEEAAEEAADAFAAIAFAAIAAAGGGLRRFVAAPQVEEARERALKVDALEAVDEAREGAGGLVAHVFQEVADGAILGKKFARPVPQGLSHLAPVGVVPPERRVPRERLRESGGGEGVDEGRRERVGVLARRVAPALREKHGEVFAGRGGDPRDEAARLWAAGPLPRRGRARRPRPPGRPPAGPRTRRTARAGAPARAPRPRRTRRAGRPAAAPGPAP